MCELPGAEWAVPIALGPPMFPYWVTWNPVSLSLGVLVEHAGSRAPETPNFWAFCIQKSLQP